MGNVARELMTYAHPHYFTNLMLAVCFYILKVTPPVCSMMFEDCLMEIAEMELLTFLGCIVVLKNRKQQSIKQYISTVCAFAKVLNLLLFVRQNPLYAVMYALVCLVHLVLLPEPAYKGPEYITYFTSDTMEEEIKRDKRVTWLVEFYAAWQPTCVNFSQIYSQLSAEFSLDNLKFGKVDVTRNRVLAERFRVNHTSWSRQLPTLILFQNGKESMRRPTIDQSNKPVGKFLFSREKVVNEFQLSDLYHQCKKNPIKKRTKEELNEAIENKKDN